MDFKENTLKNKFISRGCRQAPDEEISNEDLFSHSCCKMDAQNWLDEVPEGDTSQDPNIVEVRFKNSRKEFYRNDTEHTLVQGDIIAVESNSGHDIGIVTLTGATARLQMTRKNCKTPVDQMLKVYRYARLSDVEKWIASVDREQETMMQARRHADSLDLQMKINDVEFRGDNTKAIFYYTAEERVDFRQLIRKLAESFKVRIEMKQIGARQESCKVGGIGSCGRELCCATWLCNFKSVSTSTARTQQLAPNPQKLAGQCAKLKCCLNYENEAYLDELKEFPSNRAVLKTKSGNAYFVKNDVFKKVMWYSYQGNNNMALVPLPIDKVKNLIELNEQDIIPENLEDFSVKEKGKEVDGYENKLNQEDLTRFDKKKGKENTNDNGRDRTHVHRASRQEGNEKGKRQNNRRRNSNNRNRPPVDASNKTEQ